jgi:hypothetical protein
MKKPCGRLQQESVGVLNEHDKAIANVVHVVVRDYQGNLMAFFNHIHRPTEENEKETKQESSQLEGVFSRCRCRRRKKSS